MINFPNYAGKVIDEEMRLELEFAGIPVLTVEEGLRGIMASEVKTCTYGSLFGWNFKRAWRYWVCEGPGIPAQDAWDLNIKFGSCVRVDGHASGRNPIEAHHGLGVGFYHVDTFEGLRALARIIKGVSERNNHIGKPIDI